MCVSVISEFSRIHWSEVINSSLIDSRVFLVIEVTLDSVLDYTPEISGLGL